VLDFYPAADLYVSPSQEDSFAMPVAEAMACGLPAITSVFAGVSSVLHDGVDSFILRDPRDAKTLATMIRTLYQKAEWRSRMGQAAARASLEWTWDRNAAAVWDLLRNAVGKKRQLSTKKI
jgi:UDP-glucose:(heptosyl)LPS alpha-1,3-glucosyltransferase